MKRTPTILDQFLSYARHSLREHHLPRISRCLQVLTDEDIWWRPNPASNSVGNLILHLEGNVRQWIVSGLGRERDCRQRSLEFAERGPIRRRSLLTRLRKTVAQAVRVIERLSAPDLARQYKIQGFRVTGFQALCHVTEHFAHHTGQIIFVAKLKRGVDLGFTRLPGERAKASKAKPLPAL